MKNSAYNSNACAGCCFDVGASPANPEAIGGSIHCTTDFPYAKTCPQNDRWHGRRHASIGHDSIHDGGVSNAGGDGAFGCDSVGDSTQRASSRGQSTISLLQPHAAAEGCRNADGPSAICACIPSFYVSSGQLRTGSQFMLKLKSTCNFSAPLHFLGGGTLRPCRLEYQCEHMCVAAGQDVWAHMSLQAEDLEASPRPGPFNRLRIAVLILSSFGLCAGDWQFRMPVRQGPDNLTHYVLGYYPHSLLSVKMSAGHGVAAITT